jgi:predicted RNA-binding protein (virulence factor B family)
MAELGRFNHLVVTGVTDTGVLLDGGELGALGCTAGGEESPAVGDTLRVFVYRDNQGEPAASTDEPRAQVGEVAWLEIVEVNSSGAFADWGLPKDLFIPFGEQQTPLREGDHALVFVYLDNQQRITGSTRIDRWLEDQAAGFRLGQQVSALIGDRTELGYKVIVDKRCWGLLYSSDLATPVRKGETHVAYIRFVRPDGKLDLTLSRPGYNRDKIDAVAEKILETLAEHGGQVMLSDKSPPQAIMAVFGVSKKVFKQALGSLYKQRLIALEAKSIRLLSR